MHLITRNVNTAFRSLVTMFADWNSQATREINVIRRPSRNGSVLVIDEPVTITYTHPRERVLFNQARDTNPFALLYEAMWMLAGRNDVTPLAYYCKRFRDYSDDGETLNGAYGYRWRYAMTTLDIPAESGLLEVEDKTDQLDLLVSHLKADPTSRRAVLAMWNVEDDLLRVGGGKDICCNLSVMFSLREETTTHYRGHQGIAKEDRRVLDMTVTNRSNDLVWGMLGANQVCFSVLLEYMAARLGAEVGRYHHFTNNLHVYDDPGNPKVAPWRPEEWLNDRQQDWYGVGAIREHGPITNVFPLVRDSEAFERELPQVVDSYGPGPDWAGVGKEWDESFFNDVVHPMFMAYRCYKMRDFNGLFWAHVNEIAADDWKIACTNWLKRRTKNHVG